MVIFAVMGKLGEGMSYEFRSCPVCGVAFTKRGLPIHMSVHSSERVRSTYKAAEDRQIWLSYRQRLKAARLAASGEMKQTDTI